MLAPGSFAVAAAESGTTILTGTGTGSVQAPAEGRTGRSAGAQFPGTAGPASSTARTIRASALSEVDDGLVRTGRAPGVLLLGGRAAGLLGLIAARVVQGAGAAVMTPTALSIISTTFTEGSERNEALGIWGALGGVGATTAVPATSARN